jgi:2-polyprenyl-3-methyl-5-hydroxy-6-metoxy-1,4-benzoquinol methylase
MNFLQLNQELGNADLLLIDQILRGKFEPGNRILDAGCGEGRNMVYFIRNGYPVYGIDKDPESVAMARLMAASINRSYTTENILHSSIEENPFPDGFFDLVICINVLHHARNTDHIKLMIDAMARILKKEGMMYLVMESRITPYSEVMSSKAGGKGQIKKDKKVYLTVELLETMTSGKRLERAGRIRSYLVEDMVSISGIWFRKI